MEYSEFNAIADNLVAVCYPQGSLDSFGNAFFNVGDFQVNEDVDDLAFTLASNAQLANHSLDEGRYATGMSNKGISVTRRARLPTFFKLWHRLRYDHAGHHGCTQSKLDDQHFEIHTNDDVTYYDETHQPAWLGSLSEHS